MKITKAQMLATIREAVGQCDGEEREVLDTLLDEAECWKMRMAEIDEDGGAA